MPLSQEVLDLISDAKDVLVETRAGEKRVETTIWVAVQDDQVYVRSVRGDHGRWYQRAVADPDVILVVGQYRIPFRAEPANDDISIEAASRAFRLKYPRGGSLDSMLRSEVLHTTMQLVPRT